MQYMHILDKGTHSSETLEFQDFQGLFYDNYLRTFWKTLQYTAS